MKKLKYVKLFEKFIDGSEYEQDEIVYSHKQLDTITNKPLGIVEFDYDNYPDVPFRCLVWDNEDDDYRLILGETTLSDAIGEVNLKVEELYGK